MIELRKVVSGYGSARILNEVELQVPQGSVSVLIGPNGAGKSTVLKAIFGVVPIWEGEVLLDGKRIIPSPTTSLSNKISYVPQGRCNFPELTVQENLEMAAYTRSDRVAIRRDIEMIYERFSALGVARKKAAGNLSGGQQQMLETAMALMLHPRIILIDEPSIGLAPIVVKQILSDLAELAAAGTTIVMVEQNVTAAMTIATELSVLETGRVRITGKPDEVMAHPELRGLYLGAPGGRE